MVIAYIDFQRAFDSVPHPKLLHKLIGYGIGGNLLFWLSSFLTGRQQCVRVGSSLSQSCIVTSGVPQGSVVGPLLFNLYINDTTDNLDFNTSSTKSFADDVKIYTEITPNTNTLQLIFWRILTLSTSGLPNGNSQFHTPSVTFFTSVIQNPSSTFPFLESRYIKPLTPLTLEYYSILIWNSKHIFLTLSNEQSNKLLWFTAALFREILKIWSEPSKHTSDL